MSKEYLPEKKDLGTDRFDAASLEVYQNLPVKTFDGTKEITLKKERFGGLGWKIAAPEKDSRGSEEDETDKEYRSDYVELGKRGQHKFTDSGRELAFQNWSNLLALAGDNATPEDIKNISQSIIKTLKNTEWADQEYIKVLDRSFRMRTRHFEKNYLAEPKELDSEVELDERIPQLNFAEGSNRKGTSKIQWRNPAFAGLLLGIGGGIVLGGDKKIDSPDIQKAFNDSNNTKFAEAVPAVAELPKIPDLSKIVSEETSLKVITPVPLAIKPELNEFLPRYPLPIIESNPKKASNILYEVSEPVEVPEQLFNFKGIDFASNNQKITISFKLKESISKLIAGEQSEISSTFSPFPYSDSATKEESFMYMEKVKPGTETLGTKIDKYGNIIIYDHSGYDNTKPLQAEALREFIEGGSINKPNERLTADETNKRIKELEDTTAELNQSDTKITLNKVIIDIIPHKYSDSIYVDTYTILDAIVSATGEQESIFNYFKTHRGIIRVFCGWAPDTNYKNWWSYRAIVIAMAEKEEDENDFNSGKSSY